MQAPLLRNFTNVDRRGYEFVTNLAGPVLVIDWRSSRRRGDQSGRGGTVYPGDAVAPAPAPVLQAMVPCCRRRARDLAGRGLFDASRGDRCANRPANAGPTNS